MLCAPAHLCLLSSSISRLLALIPQTSRGKRQTGHQGGSRLASSILAPQCLSCLSLLSCESPGSGLCCFLSSAPQAAVSSPQIIINLGIESVEGNFASPGSSLDLFLFVCADKREHVVVSQEARLELPGALAIRCRQRPVEDREGSPLSVIIGVAKEKTQD